MVQYWKTSESVEAKVYLHKDGHYEMQMAGEKYPFQGFPRGILLFGQLSPLKHWIKNKIFNDTWKMLDEKKSSAEIMEYLHTDALPYIFDLSEKTKYDMLPPERMVPAVREIHRAMSTIEGTTWNKLKDILCFILQEDDAYRMRFQWIVKFFPRWYTPTLKHFELGLKMLEHAESIGDMKERQRLFRRVALFVLQNPAIRAKVERLFKEIDWSKVKLSKADKYFFRAKYFKVDYPEYQY